MENLKIVPSVATDDMAKAMAIKAAEILAENDTDWSPEHGEKDVWEAALSAAPDYSHLVIVERAKIEAIEGKILISRDDAELIAATPSKDKFEEYVKAITRLRAKLEGDDAYRRNYGLLSIWESEYAYYKRTIRSRTTSIPYEGWWD